MNEQTKNSSLLNTMEFPIPYAHELMLPIKAIAIETKVLDVLKLFDIYSELNALSVVDNHATVGIITRCNPLNQIPRVFASQLFANSQLKDLLATAPDIFKTPLIVHVDDRINEVMKSFFDLGLKVEMLPVRNSKGILGIVKRSDMMLKLLAVQNEHIDTLTQTSARLKAEVDTAAILQHNLLRPGNINLLGLRGLATLITCSEIGGDFYDYYVVDARWIVLIVGDVSGHGVASGTIVSVAKATVNLMETDREKEPHKILEYLSNTIIKTARQSLLMTMFVATLDTQTGELRYANAGHQFPYLYHFATGKLSMLEEAAGLPLGKLENIKYEQYVIEIEVGDRLFIYTDAIVEEESPEQECFGYDRLEELLGEYLKGDFEHLRDVLLERFTSHVERFDFGDDVTIFQVEFYQRQDKTSETDAIKNLDIVTVNDSLYRHKPEIIAPQTARQYLVFLAESNFSTLLPGLAAQGIRRVLLQHHFISQQLGWLKLLTQHSQYCSHDLEGYFHRPVQNWEFEITGSPDKFFIIEELISWLTEMTPIEHERVDTVALLLNTLIDNGINLAPSIIAQPPTTENSERNLSTTETLILHASVQNDIFGISLSDNWGSLTPAQFFQSLLQTTPSAPGGFYTLWQLADYLQLRVLPNKQTQVCGFLDLKIHFDSELNTGFQFLYHTEILESV